MFIRAFLLGLAVMIFAIASLAVVGPTVLTGVVVTKVAKTYEKAGLNTSKCKAQLLPDGRCLEQPLSDIVSRMPGRNDSQAPRSRESD